ncbi:CBASS oligonucleotide cyclase [Streptomyces sp. KO7888]|uniref:CBASS oligonucleotide cyclase n=1 Tax=Streptomyces sp. KO7888 TaxID=2602737 RepID=UPI0013F63D76|nr:CBASS oligonucleotide cyclase [Streptomyces sp. KO7888]
MMNVNEAFDKFRSNLEITPTESAQASNRQQRMREQLDDSTLDVADTFLTGAYRRATKTKPLADVDIMVVLNDRAYLGKHPHEVLEAVRAILAPIYGEDRVCCDRRAVRVDFGVKLVDDLTGDVVSFDVVPAFIEDDHYLIPDDVLAEWIPTNPKIHADLATQANKDFSEQWKPLVKMVKTWNREHGHPIEASFLIEVMALELIKGDWIGPYPRELRQFFATAVNAVTERWPDPAHLGPDVSDMFVGQPEKLQAAQTALRAAEAACTEALRLERAGRTGDALAKWQLLFGPLFTKS